jgi:cell division initiation protein
MGLTPVEIRHVRLARRPLGYTKAGVDETLTEIADSFEVVWRERADLADKVEHLEAELVRYRELEALLRTTLVSAERSSQETRDQAKREAELILGEAHAEARRITHDAAAEHARLDTEARRVRALLQAALETVRPDDEGSESSGPPTPDCWEAA